MRKPYYIKSSQLLAIGFPSVISHRDLEISQKVEELFMNWVINKENEKKSNFFRGNASKVVNTSTEHLNCVKSKKENRPFQCFRK